MTSLNLDNLMVSQGFNVTMIAGYCGYVYCPVYYSAKGAGDVNGDGYDDIIIGYPSETNAAGISYIIYGNSSLTTISLDGLDSYYGFSVYGANTNDESGFSVSGAGDVNGDGYDDLIIGAPGVIKNNVPGKTYVIYGNHTVENIYLSSFEASQGFVINGIQYPSDPGGGNSGYSVSSAGDVDNDGFDDVLIGVPYASPNDMHHVGVAYVIYGSQSNPGNINLGSLTSSQGFSISFANPACCTSYKVGWSVSGAGYVNQDLYADVIIGAPGANPNTLSNAGNAYIIYGNNRSALNSINLGSLGSGGVVIEGASSEDQTGFSVSGAGDVNGDEYDDLIIGAPYSSPNAVVNAGVTYVIFGGPSLSSSVDLSKIYDNPNSAPGFGINGVNTDVYSGWSVSGAGNINNDNYADIIIGTPQILPNPEVTRPVGCYGPGISYIIYGNSKPTPQYMLGDNLKNGEGFAVSIYTSGTYEDDIYYGMDSSNCAQVGYFVTFVGDINNDSYSDIIIGAPTVIPNSNMGTSTYVIYGAASYFVTPNPTLMPTWQPTSVNHNSNDDITQTWELKIFTPIVSFVLSAMGTWCLREKIAFYILNNWGHNYKFIYKNSYTPLQKNEIGLRFNNDELVCIIKDKEYLLPMDDSGNNGISKGLHDLIINALENPAISQSFTLIQSEKNQIRDYLINHKYLAPERTYCLLNSYTELGYIKGTFYNLFLTNFEAEHTRVCKKQVRSDSVSSHISMKICSTNSNTDNTKDVSTSNPIITSSTTQHLKWDIRTSDRSSSHDDVEDRVSTSNSLDVSKQDTRSLNNNQNALNKKGCVIMCISAMEPEHLKLQDKAFLELGNNLFSFSEEVRSSHAKLLAIENDISSSSNIDYSSAAMFTQQILEYAPTIRYFFKVLGIDLPQVHLPNEFWAGVHFAAGMIKVGGDGFLSLGQALESGTYYAKLELFDMLAKAPTEEKPIDLVSFAKACGKHIAAGAGLGLASGAPIYGAINGAAMCLNQHKMLEESVEQTAVRYAIDVVTGVAAAYSLADQNMLALGLSVVSAISMSDITARVEMASLDLCHVNMFTVDEFI